MNWVVSIWDIIWEVLGWAQICTFIDPWEEGIVTRCGTYNRSVKSGIAWHLPFELEEITCLNVKPTAMELKEQSCFTADDVKVVAKVVLMWGVFDIRRALCDVEDVQETLSDIAVGVVHEQIQGQDWEYVRTSAFRNDVKRAIQREARKWGVSVPKVKFQDLTTAESYRLFGGLT